MLSLRRLVVGYAVAVMVLVLVIGGVITAILATGRSDDESPPTPTPEATSAPTATPAPRAMVEYEPTDELFPNPERGLYVTRFSGTLSGGYDPLESLELARYRDDARTLVKRYFQLDDYVDSDISDAYLAAMEADFEAARAAGVKLIVRFAYSIHEEAAVRDADAERILRHIAQVAPLLESHRDVIAVVQAGFIGVWGEWAFTDHFSDPYDADYSDRQQVLERLLDAVPVERFVQIRTPRYKYRMSLEAADAVRVGFHNDCLLRGETDGGTYLDEEIDADRRYLELEVRSVPMGGETCAPPNGVRFAQSLDELERFRWSYLNGDFHPDHLGAWEAEGTLDEIARRLGYRIELVRGEYPSRAAPGDVVEIELELQNTGFASPFNPRGVELILRSTASGETWALEVDADPRDWHPGLPYSLGAEVGLPDDLPAGTYELLLHLPDPEPALFGRPEYSIRLANEDVWEPSTGYNRLFDALDVEAS